MAAVILGTEQTRETSRMNPGKNLIGPEEGTASKEFSLFLEDRDEATPEAWDGGADSGGADSSLADGSSDGSGWGGAGQDSAPSTPDPLSGSASLDDSSPESLGRSADSGVRAEEESRADGVSNRDHTERKERGDRGQDDRREARDVARAPAGTGGGQGAPPSSPLAAARTGFRGTVDKVGLAALSGKVARGLSARARLESFMVGKAPDGSASVRMELSLEGMGKLALTVQEANEAGAVRIVLSSSNLADAETAALASDLLKNLHGQGIQVEAVETADGRELASGGDQAGQGQEAGTGQDSEEMQEGEGEDLDADGVAAMGSAVGALPRLNPRLGVHPLVRGMSSPVLPGFFG